MTDGRTWSRIMAPMATREITGTHAIEGILRRGGVDGTLYVDERSSRELKVLAELARKQGVSVQPAEKGRRRRDAKLVLHGREDASILRVDVRDYLGGKRRQDELVLLLDHLEDPQNLGSIARTADQFCVDLVLLPERRSVSPTGAAHRVSAGGLSNIRLAFVKNLVQTIKLFKEAGFWVFGADMGGDIAYQTDLKRPIVLALGAEGKGLSPLVRDHCDHIIAIPASGAADSLNVAVACGVLTYEIRRQQAFHSRIQKPVD